MINGKEYAKQMRENAVIDDNGIVLVSRELWHQIADVIEEQQAEIKRLDLSFKFINAKYNSLLDIAENTRAEAIKQFAEKLKSEHSTPDILMPFNWISIEDTALNDLVKEMVGADNG
jgi:hypothetical protein